MIVQNTLLHGGDYNPDQWLDDPEVLEQDIVLLKNAHINFVTLGVFSWLQLEPEEGVFTFAWLDAIIDRLYCEGISVVLATPSGAKPVWMSQKYPEVHRVNGRGQRELAGNRHNHCMSSPVYREKVYIINTQMAERYGNHPAVVLWHISNEYAGHCYCELCKEKFRTFLAEKYQTIEKLNSCWWNAFWSHGYNSFDQIEPPFEHGEQSNIALALDWNRFTACNTIDFYNHEVAAIRVHSSIPATTNFFGGNHLHLDYFAFAQHVDVVAYDAYPLWHSGDDYTNALQASFMYDLMRSLKQKPFLLMESTPSAANWRHASKLKRPGFHALASIQALAHGSDMVGYFQMRKSRGQCEKFHSAVIDHDSSLQNRTYQEVCALGKALLQLGELVGSITHNEIAIYLDWSNSDALDYNKGPRMGGIGYVAEVEKYYTALVSLGYGVDFCTKDSNLDRYKLLVLPMVYSAPKEFWNTVSTFVDTGGKVVSTYMSGYADENDLIYKTGRHKNLSELIGADYHELDALEDADINYTEIFGKTFQVQELCELNHQKDNRTIATYQKDYYQGQPTITERNGNYHIAARIETAGITHFFSHILDVSGELAIEKVLEIGNTELIVTKRVMQEKEYLFVLNFTSDPITLSLPKVYRDILQNKELTTLSLGGFGYAILQHRAKV